MDLLTGLQKAASGVSLNKVAASCPITSSKAQALACDGLALSKAADEIINDKLLSVFGIESTVKDTNILTSFLEAVKNFSKVNETNDLFKGLKIEQGKTSSMVDTIFDDNGFRLVFSDRFDFKKLPEVMEELYNQGKIASDDPLYAMYYALGDYLNFSYNPYAYKVCKTRNYIDGSLISALKLSDSSGVSEFNNHYIAAKMSGAIIPDKLTVFFEENVGNTDLKFPKAVQEFTQGRKFDFKTINEAVEHLKQFGIEAEFPTLEIANETVGAVCDLVEVTGDKNIFNGLRIMLSDSYDNVLTKASLHWDCKHPKEAYITLNLANDWKRAAQNMQKDFEGGFHPTPKVKDAITHELAHYLDFQGNPQGYATTDNEFKKGLRYFNDFGQMLTAKVSKYSTKSPAEFCAEYICGKLAGLKYPKIVDDEFLSSWNGAKINFSQFD